MVKLTAQVSSLGRFRSTKGIVSTPLPRKDGYSFIAINKKRYAMHIAVATTFQLPRKPGQDYVNHKNLNTKDGRVANLEWVTRSENVWHQVKASATKWRIVHGLQKKTRTVAVSVEGEHVADELNVGAVRQHAILRPGNRRGRNLSVHFVENQLGGLLLIDARVD